MTECLRAGEVKAEAGKRRREAGYPLYRHPRADSLRELSVLFVLELAIENVLRSVPLA